MWKSPSVRPEILLLLLLRLLLFLLLLLLVLVPRGIPVFPAPQEAHAVPLSLSLVLCPLSPPGPPLRHDFLAATSVTSFNYSTYRSVTSLQFNPTSPVGHYALTTIHFIITAISVAMSPLHPSPVKATLSIYSFVFL